MTRILIFALAAVLSLIPTDHLKAGLPPVTLTAIEGEAFDRTFVEQMIRDEQQAVEHPSR
jgi:hypothetical protein